MNLLMNTESKFETTLNSFMVAVTEMRRVLGRCQHAEPSLLFLFILQTH